MEVMLKHSPNLSLLLFFSWVLHSTFSAFGQGYSPNEAVQHMTVPEGLEVKLVASEPMIAQQVAIEFDDRGRLWVLHYRQYTNTVGWQRVTVEDVVRELS